MFKLFALLLLGQTGACLDVKLGFLFPHDSSLPDHLVSKIGFSTSAGAVPVALERVKKEGILPDANISVVWRFSQCDEGMASGMSIDLFREEKVDVVIGPPCAVPCTMVGVFANYFNVPQISWAATSLELADPIRYPSLSRIIGSAIRLGRAMKELLLYFDWVKIALFYTDDGGARKCLSVAQGATFHFPKANIHIVYFQEIPNEIPTDAEIDKFFTHFPTKTRIAIICIDKDTDIRRFMLRAHERGCSGEEFIYLIPDYVRFENQTDVWTDRSVGKSSTVRDLEARTAMQNALFMEIQLSSNEELFAFKKKVPERIKGWPFYHNDIRQDEKYNQASESRGSLYSPFLHDAVYLYALALNKTLEQGGNKTDGKHITENSKNIHFQGVSGHVVMDDVAGREPTFIIKGFTKDGRLTPLIKAEMFKAVGKTVSLLVPTYALWETRGGYVPKWFPRCGWYGELCGENDDSITPYIIVGAIVGFILLVIVIGGIIYYYRNKKLSDEMALMLWRIDQKEIKKLVDMHLDGSLASFTTYGSEDVAEIVLKGNARAAHLRNQCVWLKYHQVSIVLSGKQDHMQLKMLRDLIHDNLNKFVGISLDGGEPISVWRFATKGSLQDVLMTPSLKLDWYFKYSLIRDLVNGMEFLHDSGLKSHGNLKSPNCVVNSRWVLMLTDFGLGALHSGEKEVKDMVWTSPEFLRMTKQPPNGTQEADVFGFSIIVGEIITRDIPYASYNKLPQEIVNLVRAGLSPPFRPDIQNQNDADLDPAMLTLMQDCWAEDPKMRPDFKRIKSAIKQMNRGREGSLLDHAMKIMEKYANSLEQTITDRTKLLTDQTTRTDDILFRVVPRHIAEKLKTGQTSEPESYDSVSIVFTSIAEFRNIVDKSNPLQIINLLNDITYQVDEVLDEYNDAFRVSTVNDTYLIACGLDPANHPKSPTPIPYTPSGSAQKSVSQYSHKAYDSSHHTCVAANLALHIQLKMSRYYMAHLPDMKCQLKIGIHTGPVVAGMLGSVTPRYALFGETITTAHMMLDQGKSGCIHISESTNGYLTDIIGGFLTKARGEIQLPESGLIFTHWLLGKKTAEIDDNTKSTSSGGSGGSKAKK